MDKPSLPPVADLVKDLVENTVLLTHENCPFSFHSNQGDPRVAVLAGDNGSGKSLLASMVGAKVHQQHGVSPMTVSMIARTSEGMGRAFTYGAEGYRATGEVSVSVSLKALRILARRLEETKAGLVILDEPDVGLAEGYAYSFGTKLAQHINGLPQKGRWGVLVVSHSRELVQGLADALERMPTFIHAGEPMNLDAWLARPQRRSVEDLEALMERASTQIPTVAKILSEIEENSKKPPGRARPGRRPKR